MRARIDARGGGLYCTERDVRLQALLCVYNAFFTEENRAASEAEEWEAFWRNFIKNGVLRGGPVYAPDVLLELAWLKRINNAKK